MSLRDWVRKQNLPLGVGIDAVTISELRALDERLDGVFCRRTFTEREREEAEYAEDPWAYFAGRFAAKEAVFKALAALLPEKTFDFRNIETLRRPDGSPYVVRNEFLQSLLSRAHADDVLISISSEGDEVIALAQVVRQSKT